MAYPGLLERRWLDVQETLLDGMEALADWLHRRGASHLRIGRRGERAALFELRRRGYTILTMRWRSALAPGDLDLVTWKDDTLCLIEVKTRQTRDVSPAESAVDERKRDVLRTLALHYLHTFPPKERAGVNVRFDVVSIYEEGPSPEIEVYPDAFPMRQASSASAGFGV